MTRGTVIWLTGLPGSGKSTIAGALAAALQERGAAVEILDGDTIRRTVSRDLGFSRVDRDEQVRRVADLADARAERGASVIVALVSPYRAARDAARARLSPFVEVFVDCPIDVLVQRDPKGLYRRAIAGEIEHFTGVSDPYEPPSAPDVHVRTDREAVSDCVTRIRAALDAQADTAT